MKTSVSISIIAMVSSFAGLALAQGEAPPAPEAPAGASEPAAPPPAAAPAPPPPAPAPAPPPPADPEAGGAHTHDGFYFRMGLNFGPIIMKENLEGGGATGPDIKYSGLHSGFDLMFGGTPAPGLAIGGGLIAGWTSDPKVELGGQSATAKGTLVFSGIALFGDYYLDPHKGLHILGLLGFSSVDFIPDEGSNSGKNPSGIMFGAGVGYDFWIGNEWSVGPVGRVIYSSMSAEENGVKDKVSYLYPSIGVAFTLH